MCSPQKKIVLNFHLDMPSKTITKNTAILNHFKKNDPVIFAILNTFDFFAKIQPKSPSLYYPHLMENIIGQQLSTKVADVITQRFYQLFPNPQIHPDEVLAIPDQDFRSIGMSFAKIKYVKDLSQKTLDKILLYDQFPQLDDEEIITQLTQVKGIGRWTAEMFLIFSLGRENVYSPGDGGLQRAMKTLYEVDQKKQTTQLEKLLATWHPYKSYASLALWRSLDNMPK